MSAAATIGLPGSAATRLRALLALERMRITRQAAFDAIARLSAARAQDMADVAGFANVEELRDWLHGRARFNPEQVLEMTAGL
jgi:hypothetical protein